MKNVNTAIKELKEIGIENVKTDMEKLDKKSYLNFLRHISALCGISQEKSWCPRQHIENIKTVLLNTNNANNTHTQHTNTNEYPKDTSLFAQIKETTFDISDNGVSIEGIIPLAPTTLTNISYYMGKINDKWKSIKGNPCLVRVKVTPIRPLQKTPDNSYSEVWERYVSDNLEKANDNPPLDIDNLTNTQIKQLVKKLLNLG